MEDTIAAISTALGVGAISIIRVSGKDSLNIVNKIFDRDILKCQSHTIHYGHIVNNNEIIDEVLISIMLSPKSFTTEDVVEINCHGGIATTNKVLELLILNGARLAEPGEFTKRAFLNGRIDLIEAEGVMDLISSKTEKTRELSINKLNGKASSEIKRLRSSLIDIISNIEVNIDYPEYDDIDVITNNKILPSLEEIRKEIEKIIKLSEDGKIIEEGINISLIGRPNVGKSSLLNKLIDEEKAIVTDIAGTTRDIVEGKITLNGVPLNIIDTAGIRETDNLVEKIGVEKSKELINKSDLVICLFNNNEELSNEDIEILEKTKDKDRLICLNKIDLDSRIKFPNVNDKIINLSIKNNIGIDELKSSIISMFNLDSIDTKDMTYLNTIRERNLLYKALNSLNNAINSIKQNNLIDMIEIDIKDCWNYLGEIIGETYQEELIDEMFKRFCLGK